MNGKFLLASLTLGALAALPFALAGLWFGALAWVLVSAALMATARRLHGGGVLLGFTAVLYGLVPTLLASGAIISVLWHMQPEFRFGWNDAPAVILAILGGSIAAFIPYVLGFGLPAALWLRQVYREGEE